MRLADKLLMCSAIIYLFDSGSIIVDEWNNFGYQRGNFFVYAFLALALIEYAKLLWPRVQAWRARRREQPLPEGREHTD